MTIFSILTGAVLLILLASEWFPRAFREKFLPPATQIVIALLPLCAGILYGLEKIERYFLRGGFYEEGAEYSPMALALDFTEAMAIVEFGAWITVASLGVIFVGNLRRKGAETGGVANSDSDT